MRFGTGHRFGAARGGGGGAGASSPSAGDVVLANSPYLFVRADQGCTATSWTDQSGNCTISQATAGSRPAFSATSFNGGPGLTFDGGDFLSVSGITYNADVLVVAAYSSGLVAGYGCLFSYGNAAPGPNRGLSFNVRSNLKTSVWQVDDAGGVSQVQSLDAVLTAGTAEIASMATSGSSFSSWVDGVADSGNPRAWSPGTLTGIGYGSIGAWSRTNNSNITNYFTGTIGALAVLPVAALANRAAIEADIAAIVGL